LSRNRDRQRPLLCFKSVHNTDFGRPPGCPRSPRARCRGLPVPGHGRAPWPALLAADRAAGWGWPRSPQQGRTAAAWPLRACYPPGRVRSQGRRRDSRRLVDVALSHPFSSPTAPCPWVYAIAVVLGRCPDHSGDWTFLCFACSAGRRWRARSALPPFALQVAPGIPVVGSTVSTCSCFHE
jgi:hypothetical protein